MKKYLLRVINILVTCAALNGCVFVGLNEDVKLLEAATVIEGAISSAETTNAPIFVALYKKTPGRKAQLDTYSVVYGEGHFQFLRSSGDYYLIAFEDSNEDFVMQDDERVGWYGDPSLIEARSGASFTDISIVLRDPENSKQALPQLYAPEVSRTITNLDNEHLGEIVSRDDQRFSPEVGNTGMWSPVKYVQQGYHGIYFFEPYSPNKIPVLFIHGINGTGGDWRYITENLNDEHFQAWVVNYPSGMRLGLISNAINQAVTQMQLRFRFDKMYVVAHSMGGLVARGFINLNVAQASRSPIKLFVSISTPWEGHSSAASGVKVAPVVVPSWYDMVPGSEYINSLFEYPLPEQIPHYVFFSHRGSRSFLNSENTDGVVSLQSQLPLNVQKNATKVMGFDEGHVGILKSKLTLEQLNQILITSY